MTQDNQNKQIILKERLETNFNFDLSEYAQYLDTESAFFNFLQEKLAARIKFFIRCDMDKLLQALYRIDVDDAACNAAFDLGEINQVSMELSRLIIIRQLQKLEYSQSFYKTR